MACSTTMHLVQDGNASCDRRKSLVSLSQKEKMEEYGSCLESRIGHGLWEASERRGLVDWWSEESPEFGRDLYHVNIHDAVYHCRSGKEMNRLFLPRVDIKESIPQQFYEVP